MTQVYSNRDIDRKIDEIKRVQPDFNLSALFQKCILEYYNSLTNNKKSSEYFNSMKEQKLKEKERIEQEMELIDNSFIDIKKKEITEKELQEQELEKARRKKEEFYKSNLDNIQLFYSLSPDIAVALAKEYSDINREDRPDTIFDFMEKKGYFKGAKE